MKKVMAFAAVLLVAGMTQAATVLWGTGNLSTSPQIFGTGGVALPLTSWAAIIKYTGAFSVTTAGGAVTGYDATTMTVMGAVNFGTGVTMAINQPGRFEAQFDDPALTVGDTYAVVVFESGTLTTATTFGTPVGSGMYQAYTFTVDNGSSEDFRLTASDTLDLTATPEPTSLALLALGVAALGLRRKFRK